MREQGALVVGEPVDASAEQRLDRRRHRKHGGHVDELPSPVLAAPQLPVVDQHLDQLLREQWVALAGRSDAHRGVRAERLDQVAHQLAALLGRERLELNRGRVQLAPGPAGAALEQLGPRHAEQHDRRPAREVGDVLHEVEEGGLRPLQVVHDHDQRAPTASASNSLRAAQKIFSVAPARRRARSPRPRRRSLCGSPPARPRPRCARPPPGRRALAGQVPHKLGQRPVGDALAVGQAAAAQDGGAVAEARRELVDEARLPDAGRPQHGHEMADAIPHRGVESAGQRIHLPVAADQGRRAPRGARPACAACTAGAGLRRGTPSRGLGRHERRGPGGAWPRRRGSRRGPRAPGGASRR